jgi:hypothetical protein
MHSGLIGVGAGVGATKEGKMAPITYAIFRTFEEERVWLVKQRA